MKMKMHRWLAWSVLPAACLLLGPAPASAQGAKQACAGDIAQYCSGIPQGGGKIAQCLRANEQKLSPACRQGMMQMAVQRKQAGVHGGVTPVTDIAAEERRLAQARAALDRKP